VDGGRSGQFAFMKVTLLMVAVFMIIPAGAQDLPDGPGKDTVEKLCSNCHGLSLVIGVRRTKQAWESTIDDMAGRGMTGTDQEFDIAVTYLARYLGRININKATSKEIQDVAELTAAEADAIVRYRTANGDFKDLADLKKVAEVDAKKLDERKDRIAFK